MKRSGALCYALVLAGLPAATVAQEATPPPPEARSTVEAYASHHSISAGFPDWDEVGLRATRETGPNLLRGELASMRRWGERGAYAAVGGTRTFSPLWFGSIAVGAGDGASYLPRIRADAALNRKLLTSRNLVATAAVGYYHAPDGHTDRSLGLGASYWFSFPLVLQGETRLTSSNPGNVRTRQHFVAAILGREKSATLVLRHAWGSEGYQALGPGALLVNFRSRESSVSARYWVGPKWGAYLRLEQYRNPTYERRGVGVGLFRDWP